MVECHYGYNVYANGGLNTSDIVDLGNKCGLNVTEINYSDLKYGPVTSNGATIMMTFYGGGDDHAVILTGVEPVMQNDKVVGAIYHYRDPSKGNITDSTTTFTGFYSLSRFY